MRPARTPMGRPWWSSWGSAPMNSPPASAEAPSSGRKAGVCCGTWRWRWGTGGRKRRCLPLSMPRRLRTLGPRPRRLALGEILSRVGIPGDGGHVVAEALLGRLDVEEDVWVREEIQSALFEPVDGTTRDSRGPAAPP